MTVKVNDDLFSIFVFRAFKSVISCKFLSVLKLTHATRVHEKNQGLKNRSSRPDVFCEKSVLVTCAKFTGKHLCQSLFFNKVADASATLLKKRLRHRCFPVNFVKFSRTPFFTEHLWWVLLEKSYY